MLITLLTSITLLAPGEGVKVEAVPFQLTTDRGTLIEARLMRSTNANGLLPGVVIAPGMDYDMNGPLLRVTAEQLAANGFIILSFNWGFITHKYRRSQGLFSEKDDLHSAIEYLRRQKDVDGSRVFLVAKSFGNRVASKLAKDVKRMKGMVALTPPLGKVDTAEALRNTASGLADLKIPMLLVCGEQDEECQPPAVEAFRRMSKSEVEALFVPGKHSLECDTPEQTQESLRNAVSGMVSWLKNRAASQ